MDAESKPVLVVGGTGFLGRKVVAALASRGKPLRALVRDGSNASVLGNPEVEIVRGDMLDRPSLDAAMHGMDAVVTSAAGYTRRRKTDTAESGRGPESPAAVDAPGIDGEHIDLGWDRPVTTRQLASLVADRLGRPVKVRTIPWPVLATGLAVVGRLNEQVGDLGAMLRYFQTGRYVADPQRQAAVFGTVPTAEDAVEHLLRDAGLGPQPRG